MKTAIAQIPEKVEKLLKDHAQDLEEAWSNCGDAEPFSINLSVKIGITNGKGLCLVGISFTKDKVKDSITFGWDDKQLPLLNEVKRFKKGLGPGNSVTIESGGKSATVQGE